ncbi:MAG: ATP-grasp domain-containing protein [Terracidiphilus sp.]
MKRIGVLFGRENSFPGALVERITARHIDGIEAEFVLTGAVPLETGDQARHWAQRYAVIVDRISPSVPFYRSFLMHAALGGTVVINHPFQYAADDKFFHYAMAARLGIAVPPTVILPHKRPPAGVTDRSLRNLEYPLDWEAVFGSVGEHGFLKPVDGGGGRDVHEVRNREEFFHAYDQSGSLCMMYQKAVDFSAYFRCCVVGEKNVRIMPYDPRRPHAERYLQDPPRVDRKLLRLIGQQAIQLCGALGYDFNTVEFAIENGIPYAIDFTNPVPDADPRSIGEANFDWMVEKVAALAIARARTSRHNGTLPRPVFPGAGLAAAENAKKKAPAKRKTKNGNVPSREHPAG